MPAGKRKSRRQLTQLLGQGTDIRTLPEELKMLLTLEEIGYPHDGYFIPFARERGIQTIGDMIARTEPELLARGFGNNHVQGMKTRLKRLGLALRPDPVWEEEKRQAKKEYKRQHLRQKRKAKRLGIPLVEIELLPDGGGPAIEYKDLSLFFFCQVFGQDRTFDVCIDGYTTATALEKRTDPCYKCKTGANHRERFAGSAK